MKYCPKCGSKLVTAQIAGRVRLGCPDPACGYVFWDNPTPTVAAVVELGDRVVLVRQKGWPEKWFGIVSGFLERDETPEQGVLREVQEELGLEAEIVRFIGHYSFFLLNQLILAFHVRAEGEIVLGDELESYKLISPDKLRPWALGTGPAVKDWLASRHTVVEGPP
jgi:NAD+ diphosphatase